MAETRKDCVILDLSSMPQASKPTVTRKFKRVCSTGVPARALLGAGEGAIGLTQIL